MPANNNQNIKPINLSEMSKSEIMQQVYDYALMGQKIAKKLQAIFSEICSAKRQKNNSQTIFCTQDMVERNFNLEVYSIQNSFQLLYHILRKMNQE